MNNQCDGCIRGIPVVNGVHRDAQYFGMVCSKERYIEEEPKMPRLLRNAIQTPDGTILESQHRHDYKAYKDANGEWYMVDGGMDYIRRSVNAEDPAVDLSLTEEEPHSVLRHAVTWGTYGKEGDQPLSRVTIADMETEHLEAVLDTQMGMYPQVRELMKAELEYRDET